MTNDHSQVSVWGSSNECWDDLLNDPVLAKEIETVLKAEDRNGVQPGSESIKTDESIGARLLAYETRITEEILTQSIK